MLLSVTSQLKRRIAHGVDWPIIGAMGLICCAGLVVLYSAGFDQELGYSGQMRRQAASMGVGVVAFILCSLISGAYWRRWAYIFFGAGIALLIGVIGLGVVAGGARRWLDLGGIRMQPSEFMKLFLILTLARFFSAESSPRNGHSLLQLILPFVLMVVPAILIMKQPDLGTALCLLLVGGSMLLLAGVQLGAMVKIGLIGLIAIYPAWHMLKDYQRNRILNFVTPELDPLGTGYHAIQSKIAVGSGAVTGKGFLQGTQTQLRFLPEQTTDFIFSVLAEEWGFVGSVCLLLLYACLIYRVLGISARCPDRFQGFVAFGVAALLFWQVVVNIGMVIGVLPVVGITLPLLSYGGSSVVTIMAGLGLVSGIESRRFLFSW